MKVFKCLAVDDELHSLELIKDYVSKVPFLDLFKTTTSPWEAVKILQDKKIDLLFLDIQMNELTGLQLLETKNVSCPVIITSAYQQYAIEGFNLDVIDYLLKPFSFERFLIAVNKAISSVESKSREMIDQKMKSIYPSHIYVKGDSKNKFHRISFNDIFYIESLRNYVQFVCKAGNIITLKSMQDLEENLPAEQFIRVHRSYIINSNQIEKVDGNTIYINDTLIPIGQKYKNGIYEVLKKDRFI